LTRPKVNNPTVTDTEDSEEEQSSDRELRSIFIRMFNEIKKDMNQNLNGFKEDTNKQQKKPKESINKWLKTK
jgi:hypothetical protein